MKGTTLRGIAVIKTASVAVDVDLFGAYSPGTTVDAVLHSIDIRERG